MSSLTGGEGAAHHSNTTDKEQELTYLWHYGRKLRSIYSCIEMSSVAQCLEGRRELQAESESSTGGCGSRRRLWEGLESSIGGRGGDKLYRGS